MKSTNHEKLAAFMEQLERKWNVQICVKDFAGFIPIDRSLYDALSPYLGHNNPYCVHIKSDKDRYHHCLSMMKKIAVKSVDLAGASFCGTCYAGVGEYVTPIMSGDLLLGAITAGFVALPPGKVRPRIMTAMDGANQDETERALQLYEQSVTPMTIDPELLLPAMEFISSYLAQSYHAIQQAGDGRLIVRPRSNTEEVFKRFLDYVHGNYTEKLTIQGLSQVLHCSESYLNHMIKKRLGVCFNTYINKLRVEHAKELLLNTNDSILHIAVKVGYQDGGYFSRVFMRLMDISPSEFRRRYR